MFSEFTNKIQEIEACITNAINAETTARKAYLYSCSKRRNNIDLKSKELQDDLEIERSENESLPQRMAEALSEGDIETAASLDKRITASNTKIKDLERSLELLSGAMPKGEPDLYADFIKARISKADTFINARSALNSIMIETAVLMGDLSVIQTHIELKLKSRLRYSAESPDMQLIAIVESFEGPIDVTGHNAITDEIAKMRYINGTLIGIENTPAGQKLAAKNGGKEVDR